VTGPASDYADLRGVPVALDLAALDPAARPFLALYIHLHRYLTYGEFRPAKQLAIATKVGLSTTVVSRGMAALEARGYITRNAAEDWRLEMSPRNSEEIAA